MPTVYRLNYSPDVDSNWEVNPGACVSMSGLATTANGDLATVRRDTAGALGFSVTGTDALHAETFQQVNGTSRFLVFRAGNIDEYDSSGTRTNRGTSYTATTWDAAAWGNQIIACDYADATQSSTGAGFTALSGAPKARRCASNINFVMLADVDDGGSNVYSDMVWWGGIRNPNTWTPSQATQAGNIRLLDVPGPILRVVPYGDKFVAFKAGGIFVGQYVGPPYVFAWKLVSTIGCTYPRSVAEVDGRLYFANTVSLYAFDGQQVEDIGRDIIGGISSDTYDNSPGNIRGVADEIAGNYWIFAYNNALVSGFTQWTMYAYTYNARTRLKARAGIIAESTSAANGSPPTPVYGSKIAKYNFKPTWGVRSGFPYLNNGTAPPVAALAHTYGAPEATPSLVTALFGANDAATGLTRVYLRTNIGTPATTTGTIRGYAVEGASSTHSASLTANAANGTMDGNLSARYKDVQIYLDNSALYLRGMGIDGIPRGRR